MVSWSARSGVAAQVARHRPGEERLAAEEAERQGLVGGEPVEGAVDRALSEVRLHGPRELSARVAVGASEVALVSQDQR